MTILKFEVDTNEIFEGYEEGGPRFEDLFKSALTAEVRKMATDTASSKAVKELTEQLKLDVEAAVERKMTSLLNEDVAMTDKWGKATFIGSVEDYIKKQIDEKMFMPVDSYGKQVTGCTTAGNTYLDWMIKKEIDSSLSTIKSHAQRQSSDFCKNKLDEELEKFKKETLSGLIMTRLKAVGVE